MIKLAPKKRSRYNTNCGRATSATLIPKLAAKMAPPEKSSIAFINKREESPVIPSVIAPINPRLPKQIRIRTLVYF